MFFSGEGCLASSKNVLIRRENIKSMSSIGGDSFMFKTMTWVCFFEIGMIKSIVWASMVEEIIIDVWCGVFD